MIDLLLLAIGVGLLLGGGELLVRGSSALALSLGISPLIIGLTVVAFGTSSPELAVNTLAALKGSGEISFGNIIGSNISNIALVLGSAALIRALTIHTTVVTREIPMMLLASAAALVLGFDGPLRKLASNYDRADGLIFLLFFAVFMYYTINEAIRQQRENGRVVDEQTAEVVEKGGRRSTWINAGMVAGGLVLLFGGGKLTVDAAINLATLFGVSKTLIGLTLVAVGTSLPELATSIIATRRGHTDIAVGNVVGSNIFNLLFVCGISAVISQVPVPEGGYGDLLVMTLLSFILLPMAVTNRLTISRTGGLFLLLAYCAYTFWRSAALG